MSKKIKNNGVFYVVISLFAVFGMVTIGFAASAINTINVTGDYNYYEAESADAGDITFGAFSGPDIYSDLNIRGTMTTGGNKVNSTTTVQGGDNTIQLVQSDLANYAYIEYLNMFDTSAVTMTMPATSTMLAFLPDIGSTRTWLLHNATSTADGSPTLTLAAGGGMELAGTDNGADVLDEASWMVITCTHKVYISSVDENIVCFLEELIKAN